MEKSSSIAALAAALAKAQGEFEPVKCSVTVDFTTNSGKRIKYSYAPLSDILEACLKPLSAQGLAVMQPTRLENGVLIVETLLAHSSGEWIKSDIMIESTDHAPQSEGSALTYARRYGLSSLLGIASEKDDDGEAAQGQSVEAKPANAGNGGEQVSVREHWCEEHQMAWFQKGKMKSYAHPIDDTGNWCHEHKKPPQSASPSPSGGVSPLPSDTQATTPAARLSSDGGQPGGTHAQAQQQPQPVASVPQGGTKPQPTAAASARAPQDKLPTDETPSEPVGFQTWGEVAAACANLGVNASQVFARAGVESGKRFLSWLEMGKAGWTFAKAWALAQEINKGAQ